MYNTWSSHVLTKRLTDNTLIQVLMEHMHKNVSGWSSTSFWDFALVGMGTGVADALVSGTDEAMVYDSLLACGKVQNFQQV